MSQHLVLLLLLPFCLLASHAIASSTASGLLIHTYGSSMLPWAWLATGCLMTLCVLWIQWAVARYPVAVVYCWAGLLSWFVGAATLLAITYGVQPAVVALYVWKDIYVVVLIDLYWMLTNTHFAVDQAVRRYGWLGVAGSLGAIVANSLLNLGIDRLGTQMMAVSAMPLLLIFVGFAWLLRWQSSQEVNERSPMPEPQEHPPLGWGILWHHRYLRYLALIIGCMQWFHALVDVQVGQAIQATFPSLDLRTLAYSRILLAIGCGSLLLQMLTRPLVSRLQLPGSFWLTPWCVHVALWLCFFVPSFLPIALLRIVSKSFDHSLFKAAKEIAYIPLSYAEKTQAKPLIDGLMYRVAKALASLLLLFLPASFSGRQLILLPMALSVIWLGLTWQLCRQPQIQQSRLPSSSA